MCHCCTKLDPGNSCSSEDFWEKKQDGNEKWIITERLVSSHIFPQVITWLQCLLLLSLSFFYIGTNMDLLLHRHRMDPMLQTLEEFKDLIPHQRKNPKPVLRHIPHTLTQYTMFMRCVIYSVVQISRHRKPPTVQVPSLPHCSFLSPSVPFLHFRRAERWLKMVGSQ